MQIKHIMQPIKITETKEEELKQLFNFIETSINILKNNDPNQNVIKLFLNGDRNKTSNFAKDFYLCKNKIGVYIFHDIYGIPKYIGKGGTSRNTVGKDLYFRITQELAANGNSHNTLSNNISSHNGITNEESLVIINNMNLTILVTGDKSINLIDKIFQTEALECSLISIFKPIYNK